MFGHPPFGTHPRSSTAAAGAAAGSRDPLPPTLISYMNTVMPSRTMRQSPAVHLDQHSDETYHPSASSSSTTDFSQVGWNNYFDEQRTVTVARSDATTTYQDKFCVYTASPHTHQKGVPTDSTGSQIAPSTSVTNHPPPPFILLLLHGGGHTSCSWALVAALLKPLMSIVAIDLRSHGHTQTKDEKDWSLSRLSSDVIDVLNEMYPNSTIPPIMLVGHSLGACIAIHVACSKKVPIAGLVVVDLVEGSAVESMAHMTQVIQMRPSEFKSINQAVNWALKAGALRNLESARVSVPDQLIKVESSSAVNAEAPTSAHGEVQSSQSTPASMYRWRTDLLTSQPFWSDWFAGLSQLFLSCTVPKLLLLANTDRLDPPMMVAQMQGKLQLDIIGNSGHSIQEDQPRALAKKLIEFAVRHKFQTMAREWAKRSMQKPFTSAVDAGTSSTTPTTSVVPIPVPSQSSSSSSTS